MNLNSFLNALFSSVTGILLSLSLNASKKYELSSLDLTFLYFSKMPSKLENFLFSGSGRLDVLSLVARSSTINSVSSFKLPGPRCAGADGDAITVDDDAIISSGCCATSCSGLEDGVGDEAV